MLLLWLFYPTAVEYEDRKLRGLFGETWQRWRARTPALLPRLPRGRGERPRENRWSFKKSLRQNGEPVIAVMVVAFYLYLLWKAA